MRAPAATIAFTQGPAAAADGTVDFSDIINNRIMALDPVAKLPRVWRQPSGRANGLLFDPQERLLICEGNEFGPNDGNRRLTRFDFKTQQTEVLCDRFEGKRLNSPNDVACTSDGHIYFTDPCYGDRTTMELTHDSVYHSVLMKTPLRSVSRNLPFSDPMASPSAQTSAPCTSSTVARLRAGIAALELRP
jgi:sugar lactone lactonase YvrE